MRFLRKLTLGLKRSNNVARNSADMAFRKLNAWRAVSTKTLPTDTYEAISYRAQFLWLFFYILYLQAQMEVKVQGKSCSFAAVDGSGAGNAGCFQFFSLLSIYISLSHSVPPSFFLLSCCKIICKVFPKWATSN